MNTKTKTGIALMALVFGIALSPILSNEAEARGYAPFNVLQGELTAPNEDKPFGGEAVGKYYLASYDKGSQDGRTSVIIEFDRQATPGTVYEGWLVDAETGEKTSLGRFQENSQRQTQFDQASLDSNFNHDLVVITEEPFVDTDPAPATPVGGAVLGTPFGQ